MRVDLHTQPSAPLLHGAITIRFLGGDELRKGPPLANSSHRKIIDAHRSPASQASPLKEQNRMVMLRGGRRRAG